MSNAIALWLGIIILAAIGVDVMLFGTEHIIFLGKKGIDLIEWLAFWR